MSTAVRSNPPSVPGHRTFAAFFACILGLGIFSPEILAQAPPPSQVVTYSPTVQAIQGTIPFGSTYVLTITSPVTVTTPTTVAFSPQVTASPLNVPTATALSYVTFSPSSLTFTGPSQALTVSVTMTVPANAVSGTYGYQIYTTGWPGTPTNNGSAINASVAPAVTAGVPPTVVISTPQDLQTFSFAPSALPATIPLSFTATATAAHPILSVDANISGPSLNGASVAVTGTSTTGNATVTATGNLTVSQPGVYTVQARATNDGGTSSDTNTFTVTVSGVPPVVTISNPTPNQVFTIYSGVQSFTQFNFGATSSYGAISSLTATLNGVPVVFTPTGLTTLAVTGAVANVGLNAAGSYTLVVTATNPYGSSSAQTTYSIVAGVTPPAPTILIDDPDPNQVFEHTIGTPLLNIGYSFTASASTGYNISAISATLDGVPFTLDATTGLGTSAATGSGSFIGVSAGVHVLQVFGVSGGVTVSTSVSFSVVDVEAKVPPSVAVNTLGSVSGVIQTSYTLVGSSLTIPLSFTGTSNMSTGVITSLTATLDGTTPLTVTFPANQKVAVGTASIVVTAPGQHTLSVTATDFVGTAVLPHPITFTVVQNTQQTVQGTVFFDANYNGVLNTNEPGLGGVTVKIFNGTTLVASAVTATNGKYSFTVNPGTYLVSVANSITGLSPTTTNLDQTVVVSTSAVTATPVGFGLNFCTMRGLKSAALSQGYWKNNVSKTLSGKSGAQVSPSAMTAYTAQISTLALSPFAGLTLNTANSIFNSKSQLDLQLLAAEYNYASGAYINGSQPLTLAFIYWGEIVKLNVGGVYTSSYQTFAASWFAAYNTSEGGYVLGPTP